MFLAHGSGDKAPVKELYDALVSEGYVVFLDSEELVLGEVWRTALEDALSVSRCIAFCVGPVGPGPWTALELDFALRREREDPSYPVIPVILRGGDFRQVRELSRFLPGYQGVSLTSGVLEGSGFSELTDIIDSSLVSTGQRRRSAQHLPIGDVQHSLERLQARFSSSLRPFLAGGHEIERQETGKVLKHLEEKDTRIVVVHGAAGCGKSGILLLLADKLVEDGRPILPIRLDRHPVRGTLYRFAATELGLPGPPGECLATVGTSKRGAVLLLDQLDALRWTGAHSSEAWDVCREMILDCLASSPTTKVVVCCRTFDLQHDPQLRNWKSQSGNLIEVQVGDLSEEQVRVEVDKAAVSKGEARPIGDRELKLLRHIHHLQMWLALYPRLGSEGSLSTRRALMEAFWQDRRTKLTEVGIPPDRIEVIEARLVDEMREGARLTAPLGALNLSSRESEAYQSLQVLQVDPARNWVSFCHQSYLDYLVALRTAKELEDGTGSLLTWLGARQDQSLFRREQLRLALEELRDRDAATYVAELQRLLDTGESVRFHLRLLCLQFLSQLSEPSSSEQALVLNLVSDPYWLEHVLGDVVHGQAPWFDVLDDAGLFGTWLAGDDSKGRDLALGMLGSVAETRGDRVAQLLRSYTGRDQNWDQRILWVLRFDPTKDSDALFDLRIELTKQGIYTADHLDWRKLAEQPVRLLRLVGHLLIALAQDILKGKQRSLPGRLSELDWHSFESVTSTLIPGDLRLPAWDLLFRSLMCVARIRQYPSENDHVLESLTVQQGTLAPIAGLLQDLGRALLREDWRTFTALGEDLASGDRRGEVLFLACLGEGPPLRELADWAVNWLMACPWRARLRMRQSAGEWFLSSKLIERYAPACSDAAFRRLEEWLLDYCEPDLAERYRTRHERIQGSGDLESRSPFGRTPHALLPKLPSARVSASVRKRIAELNRKFGAPEAWMYTEKEQEMAGFVGSPLGRQGLERMSERSLLKLAASVKLGQAGRPWRWKGDHFEEASVDSVAADFRAATQVNPERFGNLLARWPRDGHPAFVEAILSGLAFPGDHHQKPDARNWKPPSHQLLERVLALPIVQSLARRVDDTRVSADLCNLLHRYAEYPWSDAAVGFLAWVAQYHQHPRSGYFPVGSLHDDIEGFDHLESNALNVTRGSAGFTIRNLLFLHPQFFAKLQPAVEHLVQDPHPAVRVAAVAACLPAINFNKDQAVEYFLKAVEAPPDQILTTQAAGAFLRYSYQTHLDALLPVLDRMVASRFPEVATAGAKWVAASYLVVHGAEESFERCLAGTPGHREGIAKAAASLIGEDQYAEKAKAVLLQLSEDSEENVARVVASSFRELNLQHITADREAWSRFARSKAFQADPTPLLSALERQSGNLLPFAECLLFAGTTFAEELAELAREHGRGHAGDAAYYLLPLLLRLYEQAKDHDRATYLSCLDLWDRLLERRVGSVMGLTRELDRM